MSASRSWMLYFIALLVSQSEEGCLETGMCCFGQNQSCSTEDWRKDGSFGECYCDQACRKTLDCCHDYDLACPAVSCVVSEWSSWSGCQEPCKVTQRSRQRKVLVEARNGGEGCPPLYQTAGCADYQDKDGPCLQSLVLDLFLCHYFTVPALITTGGYANARKKRDVLNNSTIGYCVEFELMSLTESCQSSFSPHTRWMRYLKEGHQVCVECQPPALAQGRRYCSGDGESTGQDRGLQSLQWQAVGNSLCRGLWRRVGRRESCSCPTVHSFLFI
ncbi:hypothetical protein DNTS_017975 [Danionella cerebrum]|uniref:SMB domain-containing protein n=1 Tax=Danionella cerebrum TaxID=2873325 RepID=A0A553REB8_9TELE|nr:hypothetical protein DNTS_017975 [Danionella translucida]